jgi:hypothetical protein
MPTHKKRVPYNPMAATMIHDRQARDLPRGARVAPIIVDDPLGLEPGDQIAVVRSIRNDPLAGMHARRTIDEAQYLAGRAFQRDFEIAEQGPQAIDPGKEAVDGGMMRDPLPDRQRRAMVSLIEAEKELGRAGTNLTRSFLIHSLSIEHIAALRGMVKELEIKYIGRRVRECLDCLAEVYGFATRRRQNK